MGRPWCTSRLHLRDGLRQMEMCIPFQGKGSFQGKWVRMGSLWVTVFIITNLMELAFGYSGRAASDYR